MPPVTPRERQQRRRQKLKDNNMYGEYKTKHAQYCKNYRRTNKTNIEKLTQVEKAHVLEQKRANEHSRQKRCRDRKRHAQLALREQPLQQALPSTPPVAKSPKAYSAKHSLHRASNKVRYVLPKSPGKKRAVLRKLANEFRVAMK